MVETIVFTGAGANRSLGFSITKELFEKIKNGTHPISEKELFNEISNMKDVQDIEHVWTILENLEKTDEVNSNFKFFIDKAFLSISNSNKTWQNVMEKVSKLKIEIENIIFQEYAFDSTTVTAAVKLYSKIIDYLNSNNSSNNSIEIPIFTTNYDSVLDEIGMYMKDKYNFEYIDGFEDNGRRPLKWNPEYFLKTKGNLIKVFQLHGSLKWRYNKNKKIVKLMSEGIQRNNREFPERLIIYPGSNKKPRIEGPFQTMFDMLVDYLKKFNKCIVIGFAFRDELINNIFLKALEINQKLELVIITPHANENKDQNDLYLKVKENKKITNKRLKFISQTFNNLNLKTIL
jgi:anion-transporting  ArsA/GET3 family ATPase